MTARFRLSVLFLVALLLFPVLAMGQNAPIPFGDDDTLEEIRSKIQANGYDFTVDETWIYKLPKEEKERMFRRRQGSPSARAAAGAVPLSALNLPKMALPSSFDWRSVDGKSYIGPIRNQGGCGSCYAFGAAAAAEGTYNKAMGLTDANVVDLSESYIAWCLGEYGPYSSHFGGCGGADYDYAELTALTIEGVTFEANFPYTPTDPGSCTHWSDPVVRFDSWGRCDCNDTAAIKTAIMTYGVVDAAVYVNSAFEAYSGNVFEDTQTDCPGSPCSYTTTNHAIALVGWNDTDNPANGYWILRNSWGTSWGESGYMRIKYTSARVGCSVAYLNYACAAGALTVSIQAPAASFLLKPGQSTLVKASVSDCGQAVAGATVNAAFDNGDPSLILYDDGAHDDGAAGDGVYANTWIATAQKDPTVVTVTAAKSGATGGQASVSGAVKNYVTYTVGDTAYAWQDISQTGQALALGDYDDTVIASVPIGFTFRYDGTNYTTLNVGANGFASFTSTATAYSNVAIPNTVQPNALLAVFWDDLVFQAADGAIRYQTLGAAPNRRFVLSWINARRWLSQTSATGPISFQLVLYEGSNRIGYQYQSVDFGNASYNAGLSATVGVENSTGSMGTQYSYNQASLSAQKALLFTPSGFTPPGVAGVFQLLLQ